MQCGGFGAAKTAQFDDWEKERDGQRDANFMLSGRRDRHRCSGILAAAKEKWFPDLPYRIIKDTIIVNLLAIAVMKYFLKIPDVFYISRHGPLYFLKYLCFALCVGAAVLFLKGIFEGVLTYEREERKQKAGFLVGKVISILLFAVGAAAFTATNWGKERLVILRPINFWSTSNPRLSAPAPM